VKDQKVVMKLLCILGRPKNFKMFFWDTLMYMTEVLKNKAYRLTIELAIVNAQKGSYAFAVILAQLSWLLLSPPRAFSLVMSSRDRNVLSRAFVKWKS